MAIRDDNHAINLSQLLSKPLISTLEADFYTAQRFFEFLTEIGLEEVLEENPTERNTGDVSNNDNLSSSQSSKKLKLRMVTFEYEQIDPKDRTRKPFRLEVPLISLIPLPLLQIDKAEFDFNLRIFAEVNLNSKSASQGGLLKSRNPSSDDESKTDNEYFKGFKARLSPSAGTSEKGGITPTVDANMKIKVQMKQADLPGGLAYWMSTVNHATSLTPVEESKQDNEEENKDTDNKS